ncbi:hypothetical protein B0H13DRAFT_1850418 [Mycena leptocephala]|nr:hypothetical protein B0H13DRAFT_1850418 [Mycena leptocephala]
MGRQKLGISTSPTNVTFTSVFSFSATTSCTSQTVAEYANEDNQRPRNATPSGSGAKAGNRTRKASSPPSREAHPAHARSSVLCSLGPSTVALSTLADALHKDSKAVEYGGFVAELQRLLSIKYEGVFKIFPWVVCWADAAQKQKYRTVLRGITPDERDHRGTLGQGFHRKMRLLRRSDASMGNGVSSDPNFGTVSEGVRERLLLGFHKRFVDAVKRDSGTAEIWVNNKLTLDWLQSLVEDGFDWGEFERVHTLICMLDWASPNYLTRLQSFKMKVVDTGS